MWIVLKKIITNSRKNDKLKLKTQQRFRSEKHNVFTEDVNKVVLSSKDYKRIQLIDSIE